MVEFINKYSGHKMLVHESRVKEYEAMGHTVASALVAEKDAEVIVPEVKKKSVRKKAVKE